MLFAIERPAVGPFWHGSARDEGTLVVGRGQRQGLDDGVAMIM